MKKKMLSLVGLIALTLSSAAFATRPGLILDKVGNTCGFVGYCYIDLDTGQPLPSTAKPYNP